MFRFGGLRCLVSPYPVIRSTSELKGSEVEDSGDEGLSSRSDPTSVGEYTRILGLVSLD